MTPVPPFVSVIIPIRNEGRHIATCLYSLLRSQYPPDRWEIILADGMSEDNTLAEVQRVMEMSPVAIMLVENPRRVTPFALNAALAHARGSVIIRVDAHAEFEGDYIATCVQVLVEREADVVGGWCAAAPGAATTMGHAIAIAMMHPFGVGNATMRISRKAQEVDTVPFGCFRADVFTRIGVFDERLVRNQDYELNQRVRRAGGRIFLDPRITLRYFSRPTLRALLHQSWANGFWNALCHYLHPYSMSLRHGVPMAFTLGMLAMLALSLADCCHPLPTWLAGGMQALWGIYALYGLLDIMISANLAARHGWRMLPAFCALFPSFHFMNGAGLIWGWIHALLRRYPWHGTDHRPTWEELRQHPSPPLLASQLAKQARSDVPEDKYVTDQAPASPLEGGG